MKSTGSDTPILSTVRITNDGRCWLINTRWLHRDSQAGGKDTRCNSWRMTAQWACNLLKFIALYLGTVTLLRYSDSLEACQAVLIVALVPIVITNSIAEASAWYDTGKAYFELMWLLWQLGEEGRDLLGTARRIKQITATGKKTSFFTVKEVVHCLNSKSAEEAVGLLESLASQKYHCKLLPKVVQELQADLQRWVGYRRVSRASHRCSQESRRSSLKAMPGEALGRVGRNPIVQACASDGDSEHFGV